ncbi:MAG TPA: hypothetical protein VGO07_00115 [Candidatus Saccharimonadales bacterium]|nr:hypothetical protein [Candidatus Saccharimonadales bacterium]
MAFSIRFNEEKNQLLGATRGITFEEIIDDIQAGGLLADIVHPSERRSNQRVYVVKVKSYAYAVPYVINMQKKEIFLKTIYPSRALTKKYIQEGDSHD